MKPKIDSMRNSTHAHNRIPFFVINFSILTFLVLSCSVREKPVKGTITELNENQIQKGDKILALVGATLIDGNGGAPIQNACVIIHHDRIEAVGKSGEVVIPEGAETVTLSGMTLLPGLIDAHYHNEASLEMAPLYLQRGITSVRDPGAWMEA